jgi:hypothetical protein
MILKDKIQTSSASIKLGAGIKQEQDVAFHLRRAYKNSDNVMVLNNLRIERCSGCTEPGKFRLPFHQQLTVLVARNAKQKACKFAGLDLSA